MISSIPVIQTAYRNPKPCQLLVNPMEYKTFAPCGIRALWSHPGTEDLQAAASTYGYRAEQIWPSMDVALPFQATCIHMLTRDTATATHCGLCRPARLDF